MLCDKQRNFEFSANFFRKYPEIYLKNVRCKVREGYMTPLIEILQSGRGPFAEKSPFSVKAKNFLSDTCFLKKKCTL